jgi:DNA-binding Xre family transcriptional regulator
MWIDVGKCLRVAQARKGLSNLELAEKMKKSPQQICRWRTQPDLRVQTVQSLCVALDIELNDFLQI